MSCVDPIPEQQRAYCLALSGNDGGRGEVAVAGGVGTRGWLWGPVVADVLDAAAGGGGGGCSGRAMRESRDVGGKRGVLWLAIIFIIHI